MDERECGVRRAARQQDQEQRGQCRQCTAPLAVQLHRRGAGTWRGFAFGVAVPKVISCSGSDTIDSSNEQVAFAPPRPTPHAHLIPRVVCGRTRTLMSHGHAHTMATTSSQISALIHTRRSIDRPPHHTIAPTAHRHASGAPSFTLVAAAVRSSFGVAADARKGGEVRRDILGELRPRDGPTGRALLGVVWLVRAVASLKHGDDLTGAADGGD